MDKPKGIIQIRIKDVGDFIQVEIEDNGKGIAAKDIVYIFDRFYRTDVSRNSSKGGSGIGLSIVKKILEDHGGKVWATSEAGNRHNYVFCSQKISGGTNEMSKRILIIEDEESYCRSGERLPGTFADLRLRYVTEGIQDWSEH